MNESLGRLLQIESSFSELKCPICRQCDFRVCHEICSAQALSLSLSFAGPCFQFIVAKLWIINNVLIMFIVELIIGVVDHHKCRCLCALWHRVLRTMLGEREAIGYCTKIKIHCYLTIDPSLVAVCVCVMN